MLDIVVLTESLPRWIANTGVFMELVSCPQQQNIAFAPPFRGWTDLYAMYLVISKTRLFADTDMLRPFVLGFAQPTNP